MNTIKNAVVAIIVLFSISHANAAMTNSKEENVNYDKVAINSSDYKTDAKLNAVFENYFLLKDELVKTDGVTASAKAKSSG